MTVTPIGNSNTYGACYNAPPPSRTLDAPSATVLTDQLNLGTQPMQVIGQDANRRSLTLIADPDNTDDVYIVGSTANPASMGVRVKAGAGFTFTTGAPLYAVAKSGSQKIYLVVETGIM